MKQATDIMGKTKGEYCCRMMGQKNPVAENPY